MISRNKKEERMVIVRLKGGMGNQLFQYAAGRTLALKKKTEFKLDTVSSYKNDRYGSKYVLGHFNIKENFVSEAERQRFNFSGIQKRIYNTLHFFKPYYRRSIVEEPVKQRFKYDPNLLLTPANVCLDGYWQNERYFIDSAELIRKEFVLRDQPDPLNREIAQKISQSESVCVHLRRRLGVSVDGKKKFEDAIKFHGACSLDYYRLALQKIAENAKNPYFFVFSDDTEWARKNFVINYPVQILTHNNGTKDQEDLRLMSLCKHHIIANSSFSWWGAWLAQSPAKVVIAPRYWDTNNIFIKELTPASWFRI